MSAAAFPNDDVAAWDHLFQSAIGIEEVLGG